MPIYRLQEIQFKSSVMSPVIISEDHHFGYVVDKTLHADSWLDAKRAFGFELSAEQELILLNRRQRIAA